MLGLWRFFCEKENWKHTERKIGNNNFCFII